MNKRGEKKKFLPARPGCVPVPPALTKADVQRIVLDVLDKLATKYRTNGGVTVWEAIAAVRKDLGL